MGRIKNISTRNILRSNWRILYKVNLLMDVSKKISVNIIKNKRNRTTEDFLFLSKNDSSYNTLEKNIESIRAIQ